MKAAVVDKRKTWYVVQHLCPGCSQHEGPTWRDKITVERVAVDRETANHWLAEERRKHPKSTYRLIIRAEVHEITEEVLG